MSAKIPRRPSGQSSRTTQTTSVSRNPAVIRKLASTTGTTTSSGITVSKPSFSPPQAQPSTAGPGTVLPSFGVTPSNAATFQAQAAGKPNALQMAQAARVVAKNQLNIPLSTFESNFQDSFVSKFGTDDLSQLFRDANDTQLVDNVKRDLASGLSGGFGLNPRPTNTVGTSSQLPSDKSSSTGGVGNFPTSPPRDVGPPGVPPPSELGTVGASLREGVSSIVNTLGPTGTLVAGGVLLFLMLK